MCEYTKEEINQLEENYYIDIYEWEEEEYFRDWLERCAEEEYNQKEEQK